eukprot:4931068-Amphidinium_carterae.1
MNKKRTVILLIWTGLGGGVHKSGNLAGHAGRALGSLALQRRSAHDSNRRAQNWHRNCRRRLCQA